MGSHSFQWCQATGQGAMGTKWSTGSSIWTWGRTSSLWGWQSTGTGCPERLWSLLLWRYSKLAWTRSCSACCRWPFFGRGVGLDGPQKSFPTPNILWFCDMGSMAWNILQKIAAIWWISNNYWPVNTQMAHFTTWQITHSLTQCTWQKESLFSKS